MATINQPKSIEFTAPNITWDTDTVTATFGDGTSSNGWTLTTINQTSTTDAHTHSSGTYNPPPNTGFVAGITTNEHITPDIHALIAGTDFECLVCEEPVTGNLLCPICVEGVKLMVKEALKRDLLSELEKLNVSEPVARETEERSREEKEGSRSS
jgi:hypothetical protein